MDGDVNVSSVSCGSAGSCAAVGHYADSRYVFQGFVATERDGVWGAATGVPGLGALNTGGGAGVFSLSCASAGNCAGGGTYDDQRGSQGFVVTERDGVWGAATGVPGLGALNTGGGANVLSVSCASAGNCAAGGIYTYRHGQHRQGFVVTERDGVWGTAAGVPGLGALNKGGNASVSSVSCASPGNCAASGDYTDRSGHYQGFVATEGNGVWGTAIEVPGLAALDRGADAGTALASLVSCASPGSCAAGGMYTDRHQHAQGFVAVESNGRWGTAIQVPGLAALNKGGDAGVNSV